MQKFIGHEEFKKYYSFRRLHFDKETIVKRNTKKQWVLK